MGLDTSHNAWHGPYSSFGHWREWLAGQYDINLRDMAGYSGNKEFDPKHPLTPLLNHSDCDGDISPEDCKMIADELKKLMEKAPEGWETDWPNCWMWQKTNQFMNGCYLAYSQNEVLDFH